MALSSYKKNVNEEKKLYWLFAFFLNALIITDVLSMVNELCLSLPIGFVELFRNTMYIIIFILFIYFTSKYHQTRLYKLFIMAYLYILVVFISLISTPEILSGLPDTTLLFFSRCMPAFFLAMFIQDYAYLFKILQRFTLFNMVYSLVPYFFSIRKEYNMSMSYNLLLPTIVAIFCVIIEKRLVYLIPFTLYTVTIVLFGARGTIVSLLTVISLYLFIQYKKKSVKYRLLILFTASIILFALFAFYNNIIFTLYGINPNSRTINAIIDNKIFDLTGRDELYNIAVQIITCSPFSMKGILSDQYLIGNIYFGKDYWVGFYAHNLILELSIQYGVIITLFIMAFLIVMLVKSMKYINKSNDKYMVMFVCTSIAFVFVSTMFSGSYLTNYAFYVGLGTLMKICNNSGAALRFC